MKYGRQGEILRIIAEKKIKTHEGIISELEKKGYKATQATVSRDIKELGILKAPTDDGGTAYVIPAQNEPDPNRILRNYRDTILSMKSALHTIVIKTCPGAASVIAAAVDASQNPDILGSVAGDDTILIVTTSADDALRVKEKLAEIFNIPD